MLVLHSHDTPRAFAVRQSERMERLAGPEYAARFRAWCESHQLGPQVPETQRHWWLREGEAVNV